MNNAVKYQIFVAVFVTLALISIAALLFFLDEMVFPWFDPDLALNDVPPRGMLLLLFFIMTPSFLFVAIPLVTTIFFSYMVIKFNKKYKQALKERIPSS